MKIVFVFVYLKTDTKMLDLHPLGKIHFLSLLFRMFYTNHVLLKVFIEQGFPFLVINERLMLLFTSSIKRQLNV